MAAAGGVETPARDRYRTAFENGAMDEADTGRRLHELRAEIDALKLRRDEIADAIEDEPAPPSPADIERIRQHLAHVIANGTAAERKAAIEQLITEVRITEDDEIIPIFRIPASGETVRAMPRMVGRDSNPRAKRSSARPPHRGVSGGSAPGAGMTSGPGPRIPRTHSTHPLVGPAHQNAKSVLTVIGDAQPVQTAWSPQLGKSR
jgi:hypothetical protein